MQKLGQHFLKDKSALKKIATALEIKNGDTIIEIGPGHGELTKELKIINAKCQIIAIEKDRRLSEELKNIFRDNQSVKIIEGDALKILPSIIQHSIFRIYNWKLVGNIPYYITGNLLRTISELNPRPDLCVFSIQKEVAERIAAKPPDMNLLAASVQIWADPEIIATISRDAFAPPPKVMSAIIKLQTKKEVLGSVTLKKYYQTLHALFKQPRKTILNNLAESLSKNKEDVALVLGKAGINPKNRPQNLTIENIIRLSELFIMTSASEK